MSKDKPWRFSESRPIKPFRTSEAALLGCGFRTRDDAPFVTDDPWHMTMEPEEISSETFNPCFKLAIDQQKLCEDTTIDSSDLQVSIVARDPGVWKAEKIAGWPLGEEPAEYKVPASVKEAFSGARGLHFAIQVSPLKALEKSFRTASSVGHIVSAREFIVAIPADGSDFPIDLVEPAVFEERGLPPDTVWIVHWLTEADFDQPAEEALVVLINKDRGDKLLRLAASDSLAAVLWAEIATEIFVEVATVVLKSDPPAPQNKDGLLAKIVKKLEKETELHQDQLILKAKDPIRGISFLRAHLQRGLALGEKVTRVNLSGR